MLSPEIIERFRFVDPARFGHIVSSGIMDMNIKPLEKHMTVLGPAATVRIPKSGNAMLYYAIEHINPGDVVVVDCGGDDKFASTGDAVATCAKMAGANGIVIDGAATDLLGVERVGLPVFSKTLSQVTRNGSADTESAFNVPIVCGGCLVRPGDIIMGDCNGVVVLPQEDYEELLEMAEEKERISREHIAAVNEGHKMSEFNEQIKNAMEIANSSKK